jgi:hypothetical protein
MPFCTWANSLPMDRSVRLPQDPGVGFFFLGSAFFCFFGLVVPSGSFSPQG